uniref:Nephronophthisis 1 n=1 Tax=Xiphophorus maculatus TaxID=8083 RepID=A0A3B5QGF7_XIPMA
MPPKRRGPLQLAQREVDEIKRQADELAPVGNYDQRKLEEERRLQNILGRLVTLSLELSPPGPSTQAGNVSTKDIDNNSDDDDDSDDNFEEDSDGKDEGDGSTPEKSPSQSAPQIYKVLSDFKAEQEGDLSVRKGEVLKIIKKTADGWWLAQDKIGNRGVVPKTYLKIGVGVNDEHDKDSDENLDEEEDEDDDEDDEIQQSEQEEEEDEDVDEDEADDENKTKASNWSTFRKALTEIDTTDVLSAMGAIPSGFRPSTLSKLLAEEGERYRGSHYIQPELSQSQLSFKDLFLDPDTGRVRARQVRNCVCFNLWSCKMIPTPGVGVQVLSRHIRMCAFDGTQVLSNIHTVRASYTSKDPKTWNFSPRMTSILPTILDGDCFLRCNSLSPNIGVLFELGVTFLRNSTGERGDLSCGWAFLKLTDDSGNPLQNRTYELPINGGTPYEKKVVLEAPVSRRSPGGVFQQMLQARRQPKLIVKLKSASSRTRLQLSLLPDTLLHCLSCVHLLVLHRQLLADTLLMDRLTMQNADLICSPILSTFPVLLDQTDLLDALRSAWLEAETNMSRTQKRDLSYLKQEFSKVYMSSVYFLLHTPSLPCYRWADPPSEEQRARVIYSTLEALKNSQQATGQSASPGVFFDSSHSHLAFDVEELTFDLLSVRR